MTTPGGKERGDADEAQAEVREPSAAESSFVLGEARELGKQVDRIVGGEEVPAQAENDQVFIDLPEATAVDKRKRADAQTMGLDVNARAIYGVLKEIKRGSKEQVALLPDEMFVLEEEKPESETEKD